MFCCWRNYLVTDSVIHWILWKGDKHIVAPVRILNCEHFGLEQIVVDFLLVSFCRAEKVMRNIIGSVNGTSPADRWSSARRKDTDRR